MIKHFCYYNVDYLTSPSHRFHMFKTDGFGGGLGERFFHGSKESVRRFERLVESGNYRVDIKIHNQGQIMIVGLHTK